jgi:hypothetical protein
MATMKIFKRSLIKIFFSIYGNKVKEDNSMVKFCGLFFEERKKKFDRNEYVGFSYFYLK